MYSEPAARTEFVWLCNHANGREYCLVCVEMPADTLDDDIPF